MTERFLDFALDPVRLARRLLGPRFVHEAEGGRLAGLIVEVEAYLGREDRAAHTFGGRRSPRNETMYAEAGHLYVYFTYGMHYCMNVVCGAADEGVAVLVRAIAPTEGLPVMRERRAGARHDHDLCSGPAKLTQAFGIDRRHDGCDLRTDRRVFIERVRSRALPSSRIGVTGRIGVDYAGAWAHRPLRFYVRGCRHVSRPRR